MLEWRTCWLIGAAIFAGLLLPALVQQGMFLDGVTYACISRNMALGNGTFADPYYTSTLYPVFHEQPPLVFGLQSLFFRIFGDHFWVERLYSLCIAVLTLSGIVLNWNLFAQERSKPTQKLDYLRMTWLPVMIWITAPIIFWSYTNNMLECTMSLFVLLATFFVGKSVFEQNYGWMVAGAIFTVAAVLSKGPVGFFPLAVPVAMGIAFQRVAWWDSVKSTLWMALLTAGLLYGFLSYVPGMDTYLSDYLQTRLLPTLSGVRDEQVGNRLQFLVDLLSQFVIPIILFMAYFLIKRIKIEHFREPALFYFLTGLAGTFPLVFSPKQSAHYLVPAIPYFALGLGMIGISWIITARKSKGIPSPGLRWRQQVAWLVLSSTVIFALSFWGKFRREETIIRDVQALSQIIPAGTAISVAPQYSAGWSLIGYFGRIGNISLDSRNTHDYYLAKKEEFVPEGYICLETQTKEYFLWQRK